MTNLLRNGDFTELETNENGDVVTGPDGKPNRSYKWHGINEIQLPFGWDFWMQQNQDTKFPNQDKWVEWVPPELRVLYPGDLPEKERPILSPDGNPRLKGFKGNGATWWMLKQMVYDLMPGDYVFEVDVYPDMVCGYKSGEKVFCPDALTGELKLSAMGFGVIHETPWLNGLDMGVMKSVGEFDIWQKFGAWHRAKLEFHIEAPVTSLEFIVELRGRWPVDNNCWFIGNAVLNMKSDVPPDDEPPADEPPVDEPPVDEPPPSPKTNIVVVIIAAPAAQADIMRVNIVNEAARLGLVAKVYVEGP